MEEPEDCGRLVISRMVLSRMSSRLATITSISSNTDFSLKEEKHAQEIVASSVSGKLLKKGGRSNIKA